MVINVLNCIILFHIFIYVMLILDQNIFIVITKLGNFVCETNTYFIWTEKKLCGTKKIIKNHKYKTLTNNNSLGVFSKTKPFKTEPNRNRENSLDLEVPRMLCLKSINI